MANPLSVNSANQFIGSRISLISKADIRYEGVLYSLDLREATISLAKVRSFGTEDRPTERPIPMKDEIYEFIIFRGADIKSIDVLEPPKNGSTLSCGLPQDPAIIEVSSHYRAQGMGHGHGACGMDHQHNGRGGEGVFDGLLRGAGGRGVGRERGRRNNSGGRSGNGQFRGQGQGQGEGRRSRQDGGFNHGNGNGNGRRRSGSRRGGQGQNSPKGILGGGRRGSGDRTTVRTRGIIAPQQPPKVTFQDPFDFEKSNEEAKNAMEKLKMNEGEGVEGSPVKDSEVKDNMGLSKEDMIYYDKDKFFDNISCEALERTKGRNNRPDWRAERKLNAETFGLTYNPQGGRGGRQGQGQGQGYNNGGYRSYRYGGNGNYGQMRYNNSRNYGNRSYSRPQQMRN